MAKYFDPATIVVGYVCGNKIDENKRTIAQMEKEQAKLREQLAESGKTVDAVKQKLDRAQEKEARESTLRQELFEISQGLERVTARGDTLSEFFALCHLQHRLSAINVRDLSAISDKQFSAETRKVLEVKMGRVCMRWSKEARDAALDLLRLSAQLADDIQRVKTRNSVASAAVNSPLLPLVDSLEKDVNSIEHALEKIPERGPDSFPFHNAVTYTKQYIRDVRNTLFRFKCLVLVAKADGLVRSEKAFLQQVGEQAGLSSGEADELIDGLRSVSPGEFAGSPDDAEAVIEGACKCASVDGLVSAEERSMLHKLAKVLRIPPNRVETLLETSSCSPSDETTFFDPDVADDFLRSLKKLPMMTSHGNSRHGVEVRKHLEIPQSERILVCYKLGVFGKVTECAALTDENLYLMSRDKQTPRTVVPILDLQDYHHGFMTSELVLRSGKTLRMQGSAGPFFKICVECCRAAIRRI